MDQAESLRRWVMQMTPTHDEIAKQGAIVLVASATAGVGATSVAQHLALAWARRGHATARVDAGHSPGCQGMSSLSLDAGVASSVRMTSRQADLSDVLQQRRTLREAWTTGPCGIATLLGQREGEIRTETFNEYHPFLEQLSHSARSQRVVVELGDINELMAVVPTADHCLFVAEETAESLQETYKLIKRTSGRLRNGQCWLVLNRVTDMTSARQSHQRLVATCDRHLNLAVHTAGTLPWVTHFDETQHGRFMSAGGSEAACFRLAFERFVMRLETAFATNYREALREMAE